MKLIIILALSFSAFAQNKNANLPIVLNENQIIHNKLIELKDLAPEEFDKRIDDFRDSIEKYIEKKKRVCNGDFTTVILSGNVKAPLEGPKKLSKEERLLCFNELKAIYKTYINNLFLVRANFLEFLNKKRIAELASIREKTLKSIDSTFNSNR